MGRGKREKGERLNRRRGKTNKGKEGEI
jgi:hypothetical protein